MTNTQYTFTKCLISSKYCVRIRMLIMCGRLLRKFKVCGLLIHLFNGDGSMMMDAHALSIYYGASIV